MKALVLLAVGLVMGCDGGSKGLPGPAGPPGERGGDGAPGSQGDRGALGPAGDRGPLGDQGHRGEAGEPGERGEQGTAGMPGPMGPQGPAGSSGAAGTSCVGESTQGGIQITCGDETFVLTHGEDGEPGIPGSPGPVGLAGQKGDRGEAGEMGPRGASGLPGQEGPPGRDGVSCTAEDVLEGLQIVCGDVSVLIRHGEQGLQGERGEQGPAGQDGEAGPSGVQGEVGSAGPQGPEGSAGRDGQNLVARCPEGSLDLEFNGHLRYCVRKLIFEEPRTVSQCQLACLEGGLSLADKADLLTICIGAPNYFDEDVLAHERVTFTLSYFTPGELNGHLTRYDIICDDIKRDLDGVRREYINYGIYVSPIDIPNYPKGCLCGKWL